MKFIADLHIHSHYSLATSRALDPEHLDCWARIKGIAVIGTGDFTHPAWLAELKEKLTPAEQGLFRLKKKYKLDFQLVPSTAADTRFLLSTEVSSIYKKSGKVRKVHNIIFAPDFKTVAKFQHKLTAAGCNITSDGRPILGIDSRDLLEMALNCSENILFVPAHIWTPWFSMLGHKSGFDSIEECFGDLAGHIYAVETGLSADPPMLWSCSFLDRCTFISNSDAHSPEKLGREANLFDTELSYNSIIDAIRTGDGKKFTHSIEMLPQEGKYHYDGHRKCGVAFDPLRTLRNAELCPKCAKKLTVGVMHRVAQLCDRTELLPHKRQSSFHSVIPLKEILSEIENAGSNTKTVARKYAELIQTFGPELNILLDVPIERIKESGHRTVAEAIKRMRRRQVYIEEGFDGQYGRVKVFSPNELKKHPLPRAPAARPLISFDLKRFKQLKIRQGRF